jgi:hypothetical protein
VLACWRVGVLACWRVGVLAWWRGGVVAWWRGGVVLGQSWTPFALIHRSTLYCMYVGTRWDPTGTEEDHLK